METQINSVMTVIHAETDLNKGVFKTPLNCLLAEEDDQGHRIDVEVTRDGTPITLTGASVSGYFVRSRDNSTVLVNGSISGSTAHIALSKACYAQVGQFSLVIKIVMGGSTSTVFYGYGSVTRSRTDSVVDDENIIPSLDEILALIDTMETVTQATQAAGVSATTAASNANEKAQAAQSASEAANAGSQAAQTAAGVANAAAGKIDNMTVTAAALDTGQPPTAALSEVDGHYLLSLGLPRGATGATPQISVQVTTGAPGSQASVSVTGTAENPVIHLTIPRGDTGDIGALTINGKAPDTAGKVELTAADVGALSGTDTTLAVAGKAADAKATGDELSQLKGDIDDGVYGSDQYNDTTPYAVDNYCIYDNKLWKCKTACSGVTPSEGTYWEQVTISSIQTKLTCDNVFGSFSKKPIISSISTGPGTYAEIEVVPDSHGFGLILVEQNRQSVGMGLFYANGCVNISGNCLSFYDNNIVKITTSLNWSAILIIGSNYKLKTYGDSNLTYFNM